MADANNIARQVNSPCVQVRFLFPPQPTAAVWLRWFVTCPEQNQPPPEKGKFKKRGV